MSEPTPLDPLGGGEPIHPRPPTPAAPEAEPKPRSDLPARLVTAAVLAPFAVWMIALGGLPYLATVVGIVLLAQREFYRLIEDKGAHPQVGFGLAAGAALPVVAYVGTEYHSTVLMTATLLAMMVAQLGKRQIGEALESLSGTFFGVFYVGWLFSHAVVLRRFHDVVLQQSGPEVVAAMGLVAGSGVFLMMFTITVVVLCDAGAYFGGRAYGRRRLAPKISPKKSVEGAAIGVVAGLLGGCAAKAVFDLMWPELSRAVGWRMVPIFAIVIAAAGIVGDLVESLLKRDARVKDAGRLLPGTGGLLDRIDSPLMAIPVMYYLMVFYTFLKAG